MSKRSHDRNGDEQKMSQLILRGSDLVRVIRLRCGLATVVAARAVGEDMTCKKVLENEDESKGNND